MSWPVAPFPNKQFADGSVGVLHLDNSFTLRTLIEAIFTSKAETSLSKISGSVSINQTLSVGYRSRC